MIPQKIRKNLYTIIDYLYANVEDLYAQDGIKPNELHTYIVEIKNWLDNN